MKRKKCVAQSSNSYFMNMKCPGYCTIIMVFSHAHSSLLCWLLHCPLSATGRKAQLTLAEGCSLRRKQH
ncbi:40S ribosomal protein S27-like [Lemmus lemmus]